MAKASKEFIYGLNPAFETLKADRRKIYNAFVNENSRTNPRIKTLIQKLEAKNIPIEYTDKGQLHQVSKSSEHQGIVLRTATYPYVSLDTIFNGSRLLLLDNIEDPHNVGAIIRSAEIFGFNDIMLPIKGVPEVYPSVVKVSAGAAEHLNITKSAGANQYAKRAQENGYTILSMDGKGKTDIRTLAELNLEKVLLVIGGEDRAVGQFILNMSDHVVRVNQQGKVNSLNASVAAGIALYELGSILS